MGERKASHDAALVKACVMLYILGKRRSSKDRGF
jgi:hypothetical protein